MVKHILRRFLWPLTVVSALVTVAGWPAAASGQEPQPSPIQFKVQEASERLEMTVNTSRILTLDQKVWEARVNNRDVLELTPLSPTQVQVFAKTPGVTQVNLFSEDKRVFTVDVIVYADVQELQILLNVQFPNASLKVVPVGTSVMISGYIDEPGHANLIARIAEEYYPKVINNLTVSGVQQVLLRVKVMEVSRTKLRTLGFDWAQISGNNVFHSAASGLLTAVAPAASEIVNGVQTVTSVPTIGTSGGSTFSFNVVDGSNSFFGVLEALRQDNLMKVLAEPNIVAVSGRPSQFHVGGKFYIIPQGLAAGQPMEVNYGTTVDFVAIVLGNGRIRLEVRPIVSEVDWANAVSGIPGLKTRKADTGVELQAGQTLAIAGLVQSRVEAVNRGLPWVSEVPYLGALFRRVHESVNEVELLILVTPELVDAMDAHEVPTCGPGMRTTNPDDCELFLKGHLEVPNCCPPGCNHLMPGQGAEGMTMPQGGMILEEHGPVEMTPQAKIGRPAAGQEYVAPQGRATGRNRYTSSKRPEQPADSHPAAKKTETGFIGAIGYDVLE
jgi:pilus assembly protein CpaC